MFQIMQQTQYQPEPIPNGDYPTLAEAMAAIAELERELGWADLSAIEVQS